MSATHGPLSSTSALARDPAVCACALGSAGSRSSDRRRVKSEPPPVPAGEPHEGANYRSFYWGMENPLFGICSPSSRERRSESPQKKWRAFPLVCSVIFWPPRGSRRATRRLPTKNGGHCPLFLDLFCGLPDAVMFGTRNAAKKPFKNTTTTT